MDQLSMRELMFIEDEIRAEEITAKMMKWFAGLCEDSKIRSQLEDMGQQHSARVADIGRYFNDSVNIQ